VSIIHVGYVYIRTWRPRVFNIPIYISDKYVDRRDYEYLHMDTDSAYMAFSAPTLDEVVRPKMRRAFFQEYSEWFPRQACKKHNAAFIETRVAGEKWERQPCCQEAYVHDRRKPGLFKVRVNCHR
jgi:hypothetical protein